MKRVAVALVCVIGAFGLSACGSKHAATAPDVVATIYPLFEATATVGGADIHAVNLLPLDPYAAVSSKKAEELRTAALVIVLGGGTQPEVDKIVAQRTGPTLSILGDGDFHATLSDQNVWLDPTKMMQIAETITDKLVELLPEKSEVFRDNLAGYESGIALVDRSYVQMLATCQRQSFLVEKPEFSALARRFSLEQITVGALDLQSTNETAVQAIRGSNADTVFARELPALRDAPKIHDRYGVRVAVLDPIASQTDQARRGGASYLSVMGINLDALRAALSCAPKEH